MKTKLYIIGAGSVGGHLAINFDSYSNDFELSGFFDDDLDKIGSIQYGYKVLGPIPDVLAIENAAVVIGIALPKIKRKILNRLSENQSLKYPTFIHRNAWISSGVKVGRGCIVYPGNCINYGSELEDFVVLNMNCSLGHHTKVGKFSSFAPGVSTGGHTVIGRKVDIGIGACTIQQVVVGPNSVVGGQSMVIRDVQKDTRVAGVPAKQVK